MEFNNFMDIFFDRHNFMDISQIKVIYINFIYYNIGKLGLVAKFMIPHNRLRFEHPCSYKFFCSKKLSRC